MAADAYILLADGASGERGEAVGSSSTDFPSSVPSLWRALEQATAIAATADKARRRAILDDAESHTKTAARTTHLPKVRFSAFQLS